MRYIDTERYLADIFTKLLDPSRFADLQGEVVFAILMIWFEVEFVFYLVYCIFCFSLTFSSYSSESLCFTYYTSLYLLNYAYHYTRMSSYEM
jgi:hypothetical protein